MGMFLMEIIKFIKRILNGGLDPSFTFPELFKSYLIKSGYTTWYNTSRLFVFKSTCGKFSYRVFINENDLFMVTSCEESHIQIRTCRIVSNYGFKQSLVEAKAEFNFQIEKYNFKNTSS